MCLHDLERLHAYRATSACQELDQFFLLPVWVPMGVSDHWNLDLDPDTCMPYLFTGTAMPGHPASESLSRLAVVPGLYSIAAFTLLLLLPVTRPPLRC